jgi:hypothetical protein
MMRRRLVACSLLLLGACTAGPGPAVHDKLDQKTGSTVSVMPKPLELLTSGYIGTHGGAFAFLGPFEIDQMGTRTLFLWVLVPHDVSATVVPVIRCNDSVVALQVKKEGLGSTGLAESPYDPEDPWGTQWYFDLDDKTLTCFARAGTISLEVPTDHGDRVTFMSENPKNVVGFAPIEEFAERRHTPGL